MDNNTINLIKELAPVACGLIKDYIFTDEPSNTDITVSKGKKPSLDIMKDDRNVNINIHFHVNVYINGKDDLLLAGKSYEDQY